MRQYFIDPLNISFVRGRLSAAFIIFHCFYCPLERTQIENWRFSSCNDANLNFFAGIFNTTQISVFKYCKHLLIGHDVWAFDYPLSHTLLSKRI